jgi:hypothetical protein
MQNISEFGLLCTFATAMAFLADVTLAPALMVLVTRSGVEKERRLGDPEGRPPVPSFGHSSQT